MKILLVNIYPDDMLSEYLLSSYYLKSYFNGKEPNVNIDIINFSNNSNVDIIYENIVAQETSIIGFSCYIWNIEVILRIYNMLRKYDNYIFIFGGPEISVDRLPIINDNNIYYIIGEGELKFYSLATLLLESENNISYIPKGIAAWKNGQFIYEKDDNRIDPNLIPSIYTTGILEESLYKKKQAYIETQRGCKYKCKYCIYHKNESGIRYYKLDKVFQEIEYILDRKIKTLRFIDPLFTSDLSRAKDILNYLINIKEHDKNIPNIYWEFNHDSVDEDFIELISKLKKVREVHNFRDLIPKNNSQIYFEAIRGYTVINCVGIQSLNPKSLKAVGRKPIIMNELTSFFRLCHKYNILIKMDVILGLPYETITTYLEGLKNLIPFFYEVDYVFNIHILQILPGTDLDRLCDEHAIKYSHTAPHNVECTKWINSNEFSHLTKISAILFRIINSPLRTIFFQYANKYGLDYISILNMVHEAICIEPMFKESLIAKNDRVDDSYWNNAIFKEISSEWLLSFLK